MKKEQNVQVGLAQGPVDFLLGFALQCLLHRGGHLISEAAERPSVVGLSLHVVGIAFQVPELVGVRYPEEHGLNGSQ